MNNSRNSRKLFGLLVIQIVLLNLCAVSIIVKPIHGADGWWNLGWAYRKAITIDSTGVEGDLTDFPVLIDVLDSDLMAKAQGDGEDIAFTDEAGVQLSHEIELYNGSTGHLVAWVRANLSSSVDTVLYMYYGNAGAASQEDVAGVWDSNYVMVHHLEETEAPEPGYWNKYAGNPILTGALDCFGSTFYDNDTGIYHHFTSYGSVLHYTSSNGIDWTPDSAHNPVLSGNGQGVPMAWKEDGTWYMLYRYGSNLNIGLATSTDASTWTEYAGNPVLTGTPGEWDATTLDPWGVIKVGSTYYMWYNTIGGVPGLGRCVGLATSPDLMTWTKDPNNPIFTGGRFCVFPFKYGGFYYMLVPHYTLGSDYSQYELYRDVNPTFYPGDREYLGVAVDIGATGEWDDNDQDCPNVLTDTVYRDTFNASNDELWLYYSGMTTGGSWGQTGLVIEENITEAIAKVEAGVFAAHLDSTVNDNDGSVYGGLNMEALGQIDGADDFDGVNDYVDCGDSASIKGMNALTVEAWVKPDAVQASGIISKYSSWTPGTGGSYIMWQSGAAAGQVGWGVITDTDSASFFDTPALQAGNWYHLVGVYDGSQIRFYNNGTQVGTPASVTGTVSSTNHLSYIGRYADIYFDGVIDEVRISNISRSAEWISTEYNNQYSPSTFYSFGSEETITLLGGWWDDAWLYRKNITINHAKVDCNVTDFPMLVNISDLDLADKAQVNGDDIAFTDEFGTQLSHEIELYNGSTGHLVAWVRANLSAVVDTVLYMYYGNAGAASQEDVAGVWDSNYVMVHHLEETESSDPYWSKYGGNPVLTGGKDAFGSTFYDNDTGVYHHYCSWGTILHYNSTDGMTWVADGTVLSPSQAWEGASVGVPMVWKEDSTWYMLYRGGSPRQIGLANSTDAVNWVKYEGNPVITGDPGEWDDPSGPGAGVQAWGTIKNGSTYYLWYGDVSGIDRKVGLATSTNLKDWTKDPNNPIFTGGRFTPFPFKYEDYYYLLVPHYTLGTDYAQFELYRDSNLTFYSSDREYLGVAVNYGPALWDSHDQCTPNVLTDTVYRDTFNVTNDELWTYYSGEYGGPWLTGLSIEANISEAIAKVGATDAAHLDSTANGNDGQVYGGLDMDVLGQIDGADDFDGNDDYVDCGNADNLNIQGPFTVEAWVTSSRDWDPTGSLYSSIVAKNSMYGNGYGIDIYERSTDSSVNLEAWTRNPGGYSVIRYNVVGQWVTDTLYHVAATYNGSYLKLYWNGVENLTGPAGTPGDTAAYQMYIGGSTGTGGLEARWPGIIDEVRVSNISRTPCWISTEYNNQYSPSTFYTLGPEETPAAPNTPPTATDLTITPSTPYTADNLVGSYTYSDADGDAESGTEIRWYRNGLVQSLYNDLLTVPSSATSPGEMWHFTVRPSDGTDFGTLETSLPVTIITPVTYIFSDGFESGDFSEWDGAYVTAGTSASVTPGMAHHGNFKAEFNLGTAQFGRAVAYIPNSLTEIFVRVYWKTSTLFDSNTYNQIGIDLSGTSLGSSRCYPIFDFSSNRWGVRAYVGGGWNLFYETGVSSVSPDTWYCVELHLDQDSTSGVIQLWVDGALKVDRTGLDTSGTSMNRIQVGGWLNSAQDSSRTVYIDCVAVSDEYIGTEEQPPPPDTTPPTYSDVGANATLAGQPCLFYARWIDDTSLSGYIFSTNNTGTWMNDTWTPLTGLLDWSNTTKTLNPTVGVCVQYRFYCSDLFNNWNSTPIYSLFVEGETAPPIYSDVGANATLAGQPCLFYARWIDDTSLSGYIFSTNNTGTWMNDTWTPLTGLLDWSNTTKILSSPAGVCVQYRFYCNDTFDNWSSTPINSLVITEPPTWYNSDLSMLVSSSSALVGYEVNIVGSLVFEHNGSGIPNAPLRFHYSVTEGESWNLITSTTTVTDGSFRVTWFTMFTGDYAIRAVYLGEEDSNIFGTEATVNLVIADIDEQAFSVSSNSTISNLAFNSTVREITFNLSGPDGTTGYLNIFLSSNLVPDAADLRIYFDGVEESFEAISIDDLWFIHLSYSHSTHTLRLSLAHGVPGSVFPELAIVLLAIITAIALSSAAIFRLRHKLTRKPRRATILL